MLIGIDGSRAFIKNRTGIEEYSYRVIKNLTNELQGRIILYVRKNQIVDFELPGNWEIKVINWRRFWTQIGLSLEILLHPIDVLFVPAHTVPMIHPARNATRLFNNSFVWYIRKFFNSRDDWNYAHSVAGGPKKTVVVVHGLEYEFCPRAYSFWSALYMRTSIKNSCRWASQIISVSKNTKKDLIELYGISAKKISVIYEGYNRTERNFQTNSNDKSSRKICHSERSEESRKIIDSEIKPGILRFTQDDNVPYLLFIGRIEERKNIVNIIEAFEVLKEKYNIPHKLILAGKPGHNYENIKLKIENSKNKKDILEAGFISEDKKWELLKSADVFVFPTQYEGFGIPILEAQSVGCPVVASNNSSIPEITICHSGPAVPVLWRDPESAHDSITHSALLVDPQSPEDIAESIYRIISNEITKNTIIQKGLENVKRFSWEKCAREIASILIEK